MGITRNLVTKDRVREIILRTQKELFAVSAELATKPEDYGRFASSFKPITDEVANELEETIDGLEAEVEMPRSFITPGSTLGSAWLDLSRAIVRRAERRVVALKENNELGNDTILKYLNRLADLLFTLARYEES